jgi:hypothetical protein
MSVITVQQDDRDGGVEFPALHLFRRESLRFGREDVAIVLTDPAVARCAGIVESLGHHWRLTNTSGIHTYIVEHADPIAGYVQVRPGGRGTIIPFEAARVRIPGGDREYSFLVHTPELPHGEHREVAEEHSAPELFRLDPWHTYFRILVAFCEPRLRNRSCDHVPGVDEVARRLGISRAAVRAHVSYLLTNKLRVPRQDADRHPWPQQALVDQALRFGLVTPEHLGLLPEAED